MNLTKSFLYALIGLSLLLPLHTAQACRIIPLEKNTGQYIINLIKNTPDIYLAVAENYSVVDETFTFKVKEVIRGEKREEFILNGQQVDQITDAKVRKQQSSDFSAHKENAFWSQILTARTTLGSDCRLNPAFEVGQQYLVLFKTPFQTKSFELVKSKQDRWFQHVFETLYPTPKKKKVKPKVVAPMEAPVEATTPVEAVPTEVAPAADVTPTEN